MNNTEPRVGDLIFTRWTGLDARLTCLLTNGKAAHQELIYNVAPEPMVVAASAAMGHMVTWTWDSRRAYFEKTKTEWCRWTRKEEFPLLTRVLILHEAEEQINTFKYSKGELLLQGIDALRSRWTGKITTGEDGVWARKLGDWWGEGIICSKAGNIPLIAAREFPERAKYWSPSDTLNWIGTGASGWELAEKSKNW